MTITFYTTSDPPKKLTKTLSTIGTSKALAPTGQVDQLNPVIVTDYSESFVNANYCYIDTFYRYYFITTAVNTAGRLVVSCHVDYLMSWASGIKLCPATIVRAENIGINYCVDTKLPVDPNNFAVEGIPFDVDITEEFGISDDPNLYILVLNKGGGS